MLRFEAQIYNKDVADLVQSGRHHRDLRDSWAENHFIEVRAHDLDHARRRLSDLYPSSRGFVINTILEVE
jgi:hypothetical protein